MRQATGGRRAQTWIVGVVALMLLACSPAPAAKPSADNPVAQSGGSNASVSGDANNGKQLFASKGCIACHVAPGVPGASGTIGPNLTGIGDVSKRPQLGGSIPNTPENIRRWIKDPAGVKPGTMMPNLNLSDKEVDDLAALLATLK